MKPRVTVNHHLGQIPVNHVLGPHTNRSLRRTSVVAVDITTSTVIDRPVEDVAAYTADPSNAPEWYASIDSVEWITTVAFVARFLGRRLEYTYEFLELTGERLVIQTAQGPVPMETTYTWAPEGDHATRMTLRNRGAPAGFSTMVALFMLAAIRRANRKDLANLKSILEAS